MANWTLQRHRLADLPDADRRPRSQRRLLALCGKSGSSPCGSAGKFVPETKGKHLEEIEEIFRKARRQEGGRPHAGTARARAAPRRHPPRSSPPPGPPLYHPPPCASTKPWATLTRSSRSSSFPPRSADGVPQPVRDRRGAEAAGPRLRVGDLRRRRHDPRRQRWRSPRGSSRSTASRAMAHLSCVGETREGPDRDPRPLPGTRGVENVLALRGDPPRGETDFKAPEGGLSSAAELAAFISERYDFTIGGTCFPEVHPGRPPTSRPIWRISRPKVAAGREVPDHAAVLRQPPLLRLRRRRSRCGDRRADHPRRDPDRQL